MELGMDAYLPPVPPSIPILLDQVEVSGVERAYWEANGLPARLRSGLTYGKSRQYWRRRLRRYRGLTAVSEAEADAVRRVLGVGPNAPPVHVLPNGVDVSAYPYRTDRNAEQGCLIYNGGLTYGPNRDAVEWFATEILPKVAIQIPEAHLVVTGRYDLAAVRALTENPRIRLTGFLPDLRPTLERAALCVVPLRAGGGTRLKILEAWAAGIPVVSTTIGAAGLDATEGTHLRLADTPEAFAEAVTDLLRNPVQARTLATNARRYVETRFDWRAIGCQLSEILYDAVNAAALNAAPEIRYRNASL
jgi:polysaccharide biosynthesis protein PslH